MATKLVSVVTPCFNEQDNVRQMYEAIKAVFAALPQYRYEHIFIDNASSDGTAAILRELAAADSGVKVILNTRNFGPIRSPFHGMIQGSGDCVVILAADFQDPPALIPGFLERWEAGSKIVMGVKTESDENRLMYGVRAGYYGLLARLSEVNVPRQATGFGLYDAAVIKILRDIKDPMPFQRGLVAEIGYDIALVPYRQPVRERGKSNVRFLMMFEIGMLGIVNHSRVPLRLATLVGFGAALFSLILAVGYTVAKLVFWDRFSLGIAPILIGFFFLSSVQLFFVGIVGEYIGAIYTQVKNRPLVFERERINF